MGGLGPVAIKVVDPLEVKNGEYTLTLDGANGNAQWEITDGAGTVIASADTTISFYNEQIIPDLGLSVAMQQAPAPGGDDEGTYDNGVIFLRNHLRRPIERSGGRELSDDKSYTPYNWILAGTNSFSNGRACYVVPRSRRRCKRVFRKYC